MAAVVRTAGAAGALCAALVAAASTNGWRIAAAALLGIALGISLYHSRFGFASAYRRLITARETQGIEAQLVLLALTSILFAPILAGIGSLTEPAEGALAPFGVQAAIGAFMFGIGMQLAGGCASGTLYAMGGGALKMAVTLIAFSLGGFAATLHFDAWSSLPALETVSLGDLIGWHLALPLQLAIIVLILFGLRRLLGGSVQGSESRPSPRSLFRGPWPLLWGAVALAALNALSFLLLGHPWSITWGFTLWAAKALTLLGWQPAGSSFWSDSAPQQALSGGLLADDVSTMDIGIVLGAFLAAALAGRWKPAWRVDARAIAGAVIGGLLMGYGARLSYGCNIGAMVSGIASTSLHGWLWPVFALPGAWIGVRLRPIFGLTRQGAGHGPPAAAFGRR